MIMETACLLAISYKISIKHILASFSMLYENIHSRKWKREYDFGLRIFQQHPL